MKLAGHSALKQLHQSSSEAKGKAEGQRLGMAQVLKNQVQRRFADLPDWAVDRIDRADVATLERWSYRVMDATTLGDVDGVVVDGGVIDGGVDHDVGDRVPSGLPD